MRKLVFSALFTATALAASQHTSAQVKFCNNKLSADSFYSTIQSNGKTSTVTYFMQLRNSSNADVKYMVVFDAAQAKERQMGKMATLTGYRSIIIKLGVDTVGNPSGQGGLDPRHDVPTFTRVQCM